MAQKVTKPSSKGVLQARDKTKTWGGKETEDDQVGWLKPEGAYSPNTLIGNWNENRFDVSLLAQAKPLPSQVCFTITMIIHVLPYLFSFYFSAIITLRQHTVRHIQRHHLKFQKH